MNLGKRISAWWNNLLCFVFGHTRTFICDRCGKMVDLEGTIRPTLEERINNYFKKTKTEKVFKGSLKLKPGLKKYSINLLTNELRLVDYDENIEIEENKNGDVKLDKKGKPIYKVTARKAEYNPSCVYIDAMNDEVAIRKANNYIRGVKRGVVITYVSTHDPKDKETIVTL